MCSDQLAVSVRELGKAYRMFCHPGDRIKQAATIGLRKYHKEFLALKNISFDIEKGEIIGIVGTNGSGKSTLLQVLCGILKPSTGSVIVNGRISALLELGAGFNPEFTGRENVYFQGALTGFNQFQMDKRYQEIANFADIGEFIDQPVRTYSSGMYLRLAFAVAISLDPEILIVDEALAVGDAGFQARCFSKINSIRNSGNTIIFVSHALDQVVKMCDRVFLIDDGELLSTGAPKIIVGQFLQLLNSSLGGKNKIRNEIKSEWNASEVGNSTDEKEEIAIKQITNCEMTEGLDPELKSLSLVSYESKGAVIESPKILTEKGKRINQLFSGRSYRYTYRVRFDKAARNIRFAMLIKTPSGIELGGAVSAKNFGETVPAIPKGGIADVSFEFHCMLNAGVYFLNAGVIGTVDGEEKMLHRLLDAEIFRVVECADNCATAFVNLVGEIEINVSCCEPKSDFIPS